MSDFTDEQLIKQYLDGDEESLVFLIKRYLKPIYNFISRYLGDRLEAEDVTQEVFMRLWKKIKKIKPQKKFKAYLFAMARNAAVDFLRKKKILPFSEFENEAGDNLLLDTLADSAPLPPEIFERKNLAEEISVMMEKLPAKQREVLLLHYQEQFTFQEIAEILNESINTVKSCHQRGIIKLRELLKKINAPKRGLYTS